MLRDTNMDIINERIPPIQSAMVNTLYTPSLLLREFSLATRLDTATGIPAVVIVISNIKRGNTIWYKPIASAPIKRESAILYTNPKDLVKKLTAISKIVP